MHKMHKTFWRRFAVPLFFIAAVALAVVAIGLGIWFTRTHDKYKNVPDRPIIVQQEAAPISTAGTSTAAFPELQ